MGRPGVCALFDHIDAGAHCQKQEATQAAESHRTLRDLARPTATRTSRTDYSENINLIEPQGDMMRATDQFKRKLRKSHALPNKGQICATINTGPGGRDHGERMATQPLPKDTLFRAFIMEGSQEDGKDCVFKPSNQTDPSKNKSSLEQVLQDNGYTSLKDESNRKVYIKWQEGITGAQKAQALKEQMDLTMATLTPSVGLEDRQIKNALEPSQAKAFVQWSLDAIKNDIGVKHKRHVTGASGSDTIKCKNDDTPAQGMVSAAGLAAMLGADQIVVPAEAEDDSFEKDNAKFRSAVTQATRDQKGYYRSLCHLGSKDLPPVISVDTRNVKVEDSAHHNDTGALFLSAANGQLHELPAVLHYDGRDVIDMRDVDMQKVNRALSAIFRMKKTRNLKAVESIKLTSEYTQLNPQEKLLFQSEVRNDRVFMDQHQNPITMVLNKLRKTPKQTKTRMLVDQVIKEIEGQKKHDGPDTSNTPTQCS